MKKYATLVAVLAVPLLPVNGLFGCHITPNEPSCPECPPGSVLLDIDFDDVLAGTLLGGDSSYQPFDSIYQSGIAENLGFTIDIENNRGPWVDCYGEVDVGTMYDTDRRTYSTFWDDNNDTRWYDYTSVDDRDDGRYVAASRGEDSDLEVTADYERNPYDYSEGSSWAGGNMEEYNLGNALIIQENVSYNNMRNGHLDFVQGQDYTSTNSCGCGTTYYAPDDDANGGYITFDFENSMNGFGFTFADLDSGEQATITFFDTNNQQIEVSFDEFESGGLLSDQGVVEFDDGSSAETVWANNYANQINTLTVGELNNALASSTGSGVTGSSISNISSVQFRLSGSGGITHINYCYSAVPEASTMVAGGMMVLLLGGLQIMRSRRKSKQEQV